jgi:hypothetical protein
MYDSGSRVQEDAVTNKVRVNSIYYYVPNLLDRCDGRTNLKSGDAVRVINLYGCPPANTMGHCYVEDARTGTLGGLVHCNSLHTKAEYIAYLKRTIANMRPVTDVKTLPAVWASTRGQA